MSTLFSSLPRSAPPTRARGDAGGKAVAEFFKRAAHFGAKAVVPMAAEGRDGNGGLARTRSSTAPCRHGEVIGGADAAPVDDGSDPAAKSLGNGGAARAKSMTPERRTEIAKKAAAKALWNNFRNIFLDFRR